MSGIDRSTGRSLSGWEHVLQSLQVIFSTRFHERVMLRWFGSLVPHMLGENLVERTVTRFFYALTVAIELWEPRFKVTKVNVLQADRTGFLSFRIDGVYFPNAHLGDFISQARKSLILIASQTGLVVDPSQSMEYSA